MGDKATRKMDADEFRALVQHGTRGPRAATMRVDNELMEELVARSAATDADDDDLAIPVAPAKPQALLVEEVRDTRHARAMAPITKPPALREPSRPPAPAGVSRAGIAIIFVVLALAASLLVALGALR